VLEKQPSAQYAPYFGISVEGFRNWVELQLVDGLTWENFGAQWQLEHVLSLQYFDLSAESDLKQCWNFLNIRVKNCSGKNALEINDLAAYAYFNRIYELTQLPVAAIMLEKIRNMAQYNLFPEAEKWLTQQKNILHQLTTLNESEFLRLNKGETLDTLLLEKSLLEKFGS
jgi:hypothetical protein